MASLAKSSAPAKSALFLLLAAAPWSTSGRALHEARAEVGWNSSTIASATDTARSGPAALGTSSTWTSDSTTATSIPPPPPPPPPPSSQPSPVPVEDDGNNYAAGGGSSSAGLSSGSSNTTTPATSARPPSNASSSYLLVTVPAQSTGACDIGDTNAVDPTTTVWEVVYTSTITFAGAAADYTAPYPSLSLPTPCSALRKAGPLAPDSGTISTAELGAFVDRTITLTTTDKNPTVVYTSITKPNYGVTSAGGGGDGGGGDTNNHVAVGATTTKTPALGAATATKVKATSSADPITLVVNSDDVVVDGTTYADGASTTQTVVADGETVVINPSEVMVAGQTLTRPSAAPTTTTTTTSSTTTPTITHPPGRGGVGEIWLLGQPATTLMNGLSVVFSSTVAVIGGHTFTLAPAAAGVAAAPTTTVINGQTVVVSGGTIAIDGQALVLPGIIIATAQGTGTGRAGTGMVPRETVVVGGTLVTEIGQSVLVVQATTLTYLWPATVTAAVAPATQTTLVVGGDTLALGPDGVVLRSSITLGGGTLARADATSVAVVGGATFTEIGASLVALDGVTYTVGPRGRGLRTTAVVNGQTIAIGPGGVTVSAITFPYPFATVVPTAKSSSTSATTAGGYTITITPIIAATDSGGGGQASPTSSSRGAGATAAPGQLGSGRKGAMGWALMVVGLMVI